MHLNHNAAQIKTLLQPLMLLAAVILLLVPVASIWANSTDEEKQERVIALYNEYKKSYPSVDDISASDARLLLGDSNVVFVDVRRPDEQKVSMIPGAITREHFRNNLDTYRDKKIIAYCTISYRSGKFAERMNREGVSVTNLQAGLLGWVHAHGPLVRDDQPVNVLHVYGRAWELAPGWVKAVY